jgi:thiamine-monophosphate kinase
MKIKDIGGEFSLIDRLAALIPSDHAEIVKGIGDDAAVLRIAPAPAPYLLVTTDTLVEEKHFRRDWATPEQIGIKAAECNLSDIAAMGGQPQWMFASIVLPPHIEVEWIEDVYRGIGYACRRSHVALLGGDTTQGSAMVLTITLLGSVPVEHLCLRSHARPGDHLMVTGSLGASAAALALLSRGMQPSPYLMTKHLTPCSRLDVSGKIAPLANAMIDISDGLGPEVRHLCTQSGVGARIAASSIPLHDDVKAAGKALGVNPLQWALSGGEDFELLFSVAPDRLAMLKQVGLLCHKVGCITDEADQAFLIGEDNECIALPRGYDHFR